MSSTANTASNPTQQADSDPWGYSSSSANAFAPQLSARRPSSKGNAQYVPDDWDNEEEEEKEEVDNAVVWHDANTSSPMPEVILGTSTPVSAAPPPPAAFQRPLRILKRPSPAGASRANTPPQPDSPGLKSLKDREAAYQAARARIFGDSEGMSSANSLPPDASVSLDAGMGNSPPQTPSTPNTGAVQTRVKTKTRSSKSCSPPPPPPQGVSMLRNPIGPSASPTFGSGQEKQGSGGIARGFGNGNGGGRRGAKRGSGTNALVTSLSKESSNSSVAG